MVDEVREINLAVLLKLE